MTRAAAGWLLLVGCAPAPAHEPEPAVAVDVEGYGHGGPLPEDPEDPPPPPRPAPCGRPEAETAFQSGRRAMDEGRVREACALFEESYACDPATGTLLNLGNCYDQLGEKARACTVWKRATQAIEANDMRQQYAASRAAACP
jgi:hypothetical protein